MIVGVNGKPFDDDARLQLARAITVAETEAGRGRLQLLRWRAGATQPVELKLAVLGSYSATAPYDCPKSKRILAQGCQYIAQHGWKNKRGKLEVSIPPLDKLIAAIEADRRPPTLQTTQAFIQTNAKR